MSFETRVNMQSRSILSEILINLLYLTPIGYLLSLFKLIEGEDTPGVYVDLTLEGPKKVFVRENPYVVDRFHWFVNGASLLAQSFWITYNYLGGDLGIVYAWMAAVFGTVCVISAFLPTYNWHVKLSNSLNVSVVWIIAIIFLLLTTGYSYSVLFSTHH